MTQSPSFQQAVIVPDAGPALPALFAPDAAAARRFVEFFTANIRNPNTRKAYARAVGEFAADAGIMTKIGNHSFRATGITEYLRKWRQARNCPADGQPRIIPHHRPL